MTLRSPVIKIARDRPAADCPPTPPFPSASARGERVEPRKRTPGGTPARRDFRRQPRRDRDALACRPTIRACTPNRSTGAGSIIQVLFDPTISSQFSVLSSQFSVLSSQFSVLSSQFSVLGSQSSVLSSQFSVLSSVYKPKESSTILPSRLYDIQMTGLSQNGCDCLKRC